MAKKQTRPRAEPLTHPLLEKLGPVPAAAGIFLYSVKIVCGPGPRRDAHSLHERCDLICPDLPKVL
jgi:hypothetical protein